MEAWLSSLITGIIVFVIVFPLVLKLGQGIITFVIDLIDAFKDGRLDDDEIKKLKADLNLITRLFFSLIGLFGIKIDIYTIFKSKI